MVMENRIKKRLKYIMNNVIELEDKAKNQKLTENDLSEIWYQLADTYYDDFDVEEEKIRHTPGPWEVSSHQDNEQIVIRSINGIVANLDSNKDDRISVGECLANAKLIAAAPEMLQALKWLLDDAMERNETTDHDGQLYADWEFALTVIEKATNI
jgi:hypothetical protein